MTRLLTLTEQCHAASLFNDILAYTHRINKHTTMSDKLDSLVQEFIRNDYHFEIDHMTAEKLNGLVINSGRWKLLAVYRHWSYDYVTIIPNSRTGRVLKNSALMIAYNKSGLTDVPVYLKKCSTIKYHREPAVVKAVVSIKNTFDHVGELRKDKLGKMPYLKLMEEYGCDVYGLSINRIKSVLKIVEVMYGLRPLV